MKNVKSAVVPLFPLPDFFLYPGTVAPLHIFEARYRQMVNDLLDGPGRLVIASLIKRAPRQPGMPAPVFPIGTLAEIIRHEKLPEGRFLIVLAGLTRVKVAEVASDRLYRKVQVEPLASVEGDEATARLLRPRLELALRQQAGRTVDLDDDLPIGQLADLLLHCLELTPEQNEEMLAELDAARRARMALAWHAAQA